MSTTSPVRTAVRTDTHPRIDHPEAAFVAVTDFAVPGAGAQQALFEASAAAWATLPWPETLISITWLASFDGQRALAYAQWRSDAEFEAFGRTHRPVLSAHFAGVPGVAADPAVFYRRYRSQTTPAAPLPGCIVAVQVTFDGPDPARQAEWVDAVYDALAAEPTPPAGGLASHFHLSTDGTRVLNWAEWIDEAAHRDALARSGGRSIGVGPKWQRVQAWPGLQGSRVTRYGFARRLVPSDAAAGEA